MKSNALRIAQNSSSVWPPTMTGLRVEIVRATRQGWELISRYLFNAR